jgi:multimeric flavodoxin WrbA
MKVLTILGSPRKKGNTATVLRHFENLVAEHHQVDRVNITEQDVRGCLGCGACKKKPDEPGCIQKDDAVSIFNRMLNSDIVV